MKFIIIDFYLFFYLNKSNKNIFEGNEGILNFFLKMKKKKIIRKKKKFRIPSFPSKIKRT